jgi:hypothetical protein
VNFWGELPCGELPCCEGEPDELGFSEGRSQVFLQEDLTKTNQSLLYHARKAIKTTGSPFTFAWAKNGRVFLQQQYVTRPFMIASMEKL